MWAKKKILYLNNIWVIQTVALALHILSMNHFELLVPMLYLSPPETITNLKTQCHTKNY